jgi:hypothetical protein
MDFSITFCSLGCDIGTGVLNRVPADKEGVIPNVAADNDKQPVLAGQGRFDVPAPALSPGKAVKVPCSLEPEGSDSEPAAPQLVTETAAATSARIPSDEDQQLNIPMQPSSVLCGDHNIQPKNEALLLQTEITQGAGLLAHEGSTGARESIHPMFANEPTETDELFK